MFLSWEEGCKSCGCCFFGFVQFRSCKMGPSKTESLYNIVVFHPHHFSMARKDANTWEDTVPETDLRQKKKSTKIETWPSKFSFRSFCCIIFWGENLQRLGDDWGPFTCLQPSAAETFPATRLLPTTRHQHVAGWSVAAAHIAAENVNVFDSPGGPGGRCKPTSNKTCGWCHAKTKGQN